MRNSSRSFILATLFLLIAGRPALAVDWQELESDHFIIHYPENREAFARRALAIAEEAHAVLVPRLAWTPQTKTHMAVLDEIDEANGSARTTPRNEIQLYAYPPEPQESLGVYDDWMRELIYHEYTHILHTDTSTGLHPVLNAIFGKFARNNSTVPRWYTEGLAVYYETQTSHTGRLRNALFRTFLRNAVLAKAVPSLGDMSAGLTEWPAASGYYLFGAFFLEYIAQQYGPESLTRWNHEYGDDWVPYAMNRAALRIWGKTWDALYEEWRRDTAQKIHEQYDGFEATPHTALLKPWRHTKPRAIPRHSAISFVQSDGWHPTAIVRYDTETKETQKLVECYGGCPHRWNDDGTVLYFAQLQQHYGVQSFQKLFTLDTATGDIRPVPIPERIRCFAIDGDRLYYVLQEDETTVLYAVSTSADAGPELLYRGRPFEQIEDIDVKDGRIVASRFDPDEARLDIAIFADDHFAAITHDDEADLAPYWRGDGSIGYVHADAETLNLRSILPDGTHPTARTSLIDGMLHPTEDADGNVYYTMYTPHGTTIGTIRAEDLAAPPIAPSSPDAPETDLPEEDSTGSPAGSGAEPRMHPQNARKFPEPVLPRQPARPYKPWQWLWPQTWTPSFEWSSMRDMRIGLSVGGAEFSGHHEYSLTIDYQTARNAVDFHLDYDWTGHPWVLSVNTGMTQKSAQYREGMRKRAFDYETFSASVTATRTWNTRRALHALALRYQPEYSDSASPVSWSRSDPAASPVQLPSLGWTGNLYAGYTFSTMRRMERAIASNDGYLAAVSLRLEAPWLAASQYTVIANASARAAWTTPWLDAHLFSAQIAAGTSWSQDDARMPFTLSSKTGWQTGDEDTLLHGYPTGTEFGKHYLYAHAEYDAALWDVQWGHSTLPIGINRIGATVFAEWGYAWNTPFDIQRSKYAIGATVILDALLGYRLPARLSIGYAWGGAPEGGHEVYLLWKL